MRGDAMDIVEFAEQTCGAKLYEWQKECLREMYKLCSKGKVYILPSRYGTRICIDETTRKELIPNGTTNDFK